MLEHLVRSSVGYSLVTIPDNPKNRDNQQERLQRRKMSINQLKKIPDHIGWYLSGFCDGEGSFNISLRRKPDYRSGWQIVLSFNVSQRDRTMLVKLKGYLGCGIIKKRRDGLFSYDVTNPSVIQEIVLPFFRKYQFQSTSKKYNFGLFEEAVQLMNDKSHLHQVGFEQILQIREKLNPGRGRTRKYTIMDVFGESSTTIRQAPTKTSEMI